MMQLIGWLGNLNGTVILLNTNYIEDKMTEKYKPLSPADAHFRIIEDGDELTFDSMEGDQMSNDILREETGFEVKGTIMRGAKNNKVFRELMSKWGGQN